MREHDPRNFFLGLPMTWVPGTSVCIVVAQTQVAFRPTYIVVPSSIAKNFMIVDVKVGKTSQFISHDPIPAEVFSGDVVVLKDAVVGAISDLPLGMMMDDCPVMGRVYLTVQNMCPYAVNFYGAIVGPPLEAGVGAGEDLTTTHTHVQE